VAAREHEIAREIPPYLTGVGQVIGRLLRIDSAERGEFL